jgi:hypothetical protein
MRRLRQLTMTVVLMLMLATYALAGIIDTPPAPAAPPEPSATATGIIGAPPSAEDPTPATNPVVDVALSLLQSALSLF